MSYPWIRASEIGEYVYCRRAWWLKQVKNLRTSNVRQLKAGKKYHLNHGGQVRQFIWLRRLAYALVFVAVTIFVFQLLVGWM